MAPPPLSTDQPSRKSQLPPPTPSPLTSTSSTNTSAGVTSHHHHHHPSVHSLYPIFGPSHLSDNFIHAFSGATAGLVSGVITCPLDVIKTKLQAQGGFRRHDVSGRGGHYNGFTGTAKMIWKEEGVKGMYRGLGPIILGYLPTWAVYFTVYERCKRWLGHEEPKQQWLTHILSAMIAGGSSTICTNPIWVIKTRLMSQASYSDYNDPTHTGPRPPWHYKSTIDAARKMYLHEGLGAFYSGLGPALLGLTHVAVQFPLYEQFKKVFVRREANHFASGKNPGERGEVDFLGILAASVLSKICASSATYPHEVLRTRLQTQFRPNGKTASGGTTAAAAPRYAGIVRTARTVYLEEGWRAFYAGMGTNMIRALPASAMTLLTYEMCKFLLKIHFLGGMGVKGDEWMWLS
ncbi:mitochondrial carrier [Terfezia boudieri ATCC MYA-4762]|uniref:Mitochondrial carrier n=1 Tax=Terfezia boudieri ATCC MYA-4762 TaxID=1051890 RepID=A0A3N4M0P4_9PEZI|nr:mitochondrial carrier [Terfezia boudieri ATCC MYA-4762]